MQAGGKTAGSHNSSASKKDSMSTSSFETIGSKLESDCSNSSEYANFVHQNETLGDVWPQFEPFKPRPPRYFCFSCEIDFKSDDLMYLHFKKIHVSFSTKTYLKSPPKIMVM